VFLQLLLSSDFFEAAGPARVMAINFVLQFIARENHLLGINDYDVIANIYIRRIGRLVFPHQNTRGFGGQSANGLAVRVNDEPFTVLLKVLPARNECAHGANLQIFRKEDEQKEYEMGFLLSSHVQNSCYVIFFRLLTKKKVDRQSIQVYLQSSAA
jgi:hypothetical protein